MSEEKKVKIFIPINEYTMSKVTHTTVVDGVKTNYITFSNGFVFLPVAIGIEVKVPEWVKKAAEYGGLL